MARETCHEYLNENKHVARKQTENSTVFLFFNTIFVSSHMYPENPEGTQVIVGSMNMGDISDTARNRTHNLFRPKREPMPLGHSDGLNYFVPNRTKVETLDAKW